MPGSTSSHRAAPPARAADRLVRRWLTAASGVSLCAVVAAAIGAAPPEAPTNGMRETSLRVSALTNADVVTAPGECLENATIVVRDGVIVAMGPDVEVPPGATVHDATDCTVYPGLIDVGVLVSPEAMPSVPGTHWNESIRAERDLAAAAAPDAGVRRELRELGITIAAFQPNAGILRGRGVVRTTNDDEHAATIYDAFRPHVASFDRGRGGYPGSKMGAIALLRQTLLDADWYAQWRQVHERTPEGTAAPTPAPALAALAAVIEGDARLLVETDDEHDALRAGRLAHEFDLDLLLLGSGTEFRRLDAIAELGAPIIVPIDFPAAPKIDSVATADALSLRELQTWEHAPTNPARLVAAGTTIMLTTERLRRRRDFRARLETAIQHGLSEDDALAALTTTPADLLGIEREAGVLAPGRAASFVVVNGSLFNPKDSIRATWINGVRYELEAPKVTHDRLAGTLAIPGGASYDAEIDRDKKSIKLRAADAADDAEWTSAKSTSASRDQVSCIIDASVFGRRGFARLDGSIFGERMVGTIVMPDGTRTSFAFQANTDAAPAPDTIADADPDADADTDADTDAEPAPDPVTGSWAWSISSDMMPESMLLSVSLELRDGAVSGTVSMMGDEAAINSGTFDAGTGALQLVVTGPMGEATIDGTARDGSFNGTLTGGGGAFTATVTGDREGGAEADDDEATESRRGRRAAKDVPFEMPPDELCWPLGAYGVTEAPAPIDALYVNATIWTCGPRGIIERGAMLVQDGRIAAIYETDGTPIASAVPVIDLEGRHVTPGLIDCHSHTGINGGINEFGQTNTAEVRIGDIVDPDNIDWYRQLAGGLTAVNQLHGSANPIGGQNSVVKIRWGGTADDFRIDGAIGGIKFALGENVTRSTSRYPNTRMGVEAFYRDAFEAAKAYRAEHDRYAALSAGERRRTVRPRIDLELQTLVEILEGERLVHCHSYRQDEILMLIRVAESFGFTIGTFQHVLEGYKVADEIAAHGAGASSFADWWAYKVEVMDAIPHNGTLMANQGVLVSFNSDDNELARRMNTEAAKAVRYGGLEPHEALKFVTINPAKQLRIDDRVGSIEIGKDADFAVWSADPLSTYARCEQTFIEGAKYFDRADEAAQREHINAERQRIIQKILTGAHGAPVETDTETAQRWGDDDDGMRGVHRRYEWMIRHGADPLGGRPGECGTGLRGELEAMNDAGATR